MNPSANDTRSSSIQLLPHQSAFVETFFDPAAKRVIVLRANVGLGKSTALLALSDRLLQVRKQARVLIIAPAQLLTHFAHRLGELGTSSLEVDRYRYREMIDSSSNGELWPTGTVILVTREFARQRDIRKSLASTRWDLLIVDEAHQFRAGLARDLLRHVGESSERIVLSTLPRLHVPDAFSEQNFTVITWRRDQIVGFDGNPLDVTPSPMLHEVQYDLSSAELTLEQTVGELCRVLRSGTSQQALTARLWLRSFRSSPAALESLLPKLPSLGNYRDFAVLLDDLEDEDLPDERLAEGLDPEVARKAAGMTDRLAEEIERLGSDSKLATLAALLKRLEGSDPSLSRICVLTDYVATLFYVGAEIETLGLRFRLLHGSMTDADRWASVDTFLNTGGILTATSAAISGDIALPQATDLVLYDVPGSKTQLQEILGSFDRIGRRTQLNVYALSPSSDTFGINSESIQTLRDVMGAVRTEEGR